MDKSLEDIDADFVRMHFDLKDKQDEVQKKTFMKWINSVLVQHEQPSTISDLSEDLRDGVVLLNLLKALTGEALQIEKGDRFGHVQRIHYINNVGNALQFLQDKQVKMVNIHAGDIVDGRSSIIMGLIWTLILHFQIEESTKHICSGMLEESDKLSGWRGKSEPKVVMLKWAQKTITEKYGIEVKDFGASWRNGVAFNALIHDVKPHMIDMRVVETSTPRENLERAFDTAEQYLGIPRLLDPEDVDVDKPDEKSIMTYVSKFVQKFPQNLQSCEGSGTKEMVDRLARKIKELDGWVSTSIESIQHEEMEADLQDFGSKLESQYAVCQYLASEVNKLSQRVPYNFQVAALRDQVRHVMEQFRRAEETKDAKIKAFHDLNSFLEKHEHDVKMFERWKNDGRDILQKLDDIIQGAGEDASFEDLEIWKDHVNSNHISNTLMENLEVLDNTKVQLDAREGLKQQILEAFVSIKEIKENSIYKISMIEYNMEEQKCLKLLKKITTDLFEVQDSFKSEEFSHEKSLQTLEEESELVLRCQESLDAMISICGRNFDDSFKHEIEVHLARLQDLNSKISELTEKIQNGAITYNDYLERKFQVLEWIDRVESQVHQLKEANPELEDYETIHNDFKELMDEIGHQKTNIEESKVLLQNLAFNSAWSSRVDDETNLLCDLIERLESLCSTSRDAMKLSSVFVSCRELKNSIREKIEVVGRNSLLSDAQETWDDIQAIKSKMEQCQAFESSVCEVETLMEKGYALLKHADAHKFLAMFLKESFKFCCDLRNIAHEKLAILKNSLELWLSYESLKVKISGRPIQFSAANKSQLSDYLAGMEYLLGELDELGEVISKLSKYITQEKHSELLNDLESLRDNHRKEIDSLNGGIKVEELAARFEGEVCGLKKLIEDWKAGLCAEKLNEDVNMERIPQLVHRTQTLVNELTAEGFSKIHCLGELLEEIKRNEYASDDMIGECVQAFELVESSFRGFCIEMEDLHKCTVSDADHLMRCGKTIVEVSQWLQSERLTMEGFRDISEVEEQLRRALELYSKLEHHRNSMVNVNSETSLVSERNSISCLVDKLKHELEAFKNNLDSSFQKLNDLVGSWQNLLEIKRQITLMIDSISEQIKFCKSSSNQFSAGVTDGSVSDTLKIVMLDLQKLLDSNHSLKSIADEMLPYASVEFHQKISLELADNEQVHMSLVNEVLAQMDLLHEMREEFENFTADMEDCFHRVEIFNQEFEDHDFVKDFIMHDQPSLHLIETFSNKFENIAQLWNHINDKKKRFMCAMHGDLQEKLLKIDGHIRDNSELMVNTTSFCRCLIEYKELVRCLKVCLAEFEKNLLSGNDNEIDGEILILLEDGKHREELMKNTLSVINGLKNKSSECSLESALEISKLTERFEELRKKLTEYRDAALLFETLEEEVQNLYGYLNAGDAAIAPETLSVLMEVVGKTEVKNKDHLAVVDRKVMELDGSFMSNMDFLERFHHRFENLKESVDDLHKKLETQHFKEQYLLEKLVTYESLSSELEKYLTFEPEKLISFDDLKIKMASLQEQHNQVITYKELLATVNQDIKHFSGDEHLKLFSRIISICSANFSNSMEKSDALEMKLLNEIENLNVLNKHYDGFMERVGMYDTKIESLILSIQELLDESVCNGENVSSFEEELTELKTEIVSMETAAECCLLKELCQQGDDLVASHKRRLLEKVSRAQDLVGSLFANVDQEMITELRDEADVLTNKIVSESLSCINGEASTNDDRVNAQLMNIEGWMEVTEEIDALHQHNHALSNDFPIRNGFSPDLLTPKKENSQLNEQMLNLRENLRSGNELERTQNRFGEFVSRVEQRLEAMRTQNVRSLHEAHQLISNLLLEGGREEDEGLSSEIASCNGVLTWSWANQKEELKKFLSLCEEEINRSNSLRNQLTEFESWFEKMEDHHSELCSGSATYPQLEYMKKLNDFDSHLEEKVNSVKSVSHLLNSISHFDENMQLLNEGKALVSRFHQLMDSTKEMLVTATKSLEKIEDFQIKEKKVKELMNSLKLKLSAVEENVKLDEQMMEIVDVSVDLDVIRALMEQMDDADYQDLSEIDLANIQRCMESLKTDLKEINQSQTDIEDKLKQKSDIYFEYQAGMKELKKWIEEKEYFMWGLKAGHDEKCLIDENFDDEISNKMRFVEEMKEKMNSLNLKDFEDELNKYTAEIEAMKANSSELSALMKDQVHAEKEYFNGLVELKDCSHEVAGVFDGNNENNIQILWSADLINTNLLAKLSKMISCLSKVQFMLVTDLGRISKDLEMDSLRCLLLRIHSFQDIEKLAQYLESWILFQDATEKYCSGLMRSDNDFHEVATISESDNVHQYLQNLCSSPKHHQNIVNLLKTLSESLEPVALATTCQQAKALWDDIYANGRRLVSTLMHWTSVFKEVSESWNEFSSIYNEISEFLNLPKRDVEKHHLSEVQNPAQCQDRIKSFNFMEKKMASMMEAVQKVMTFLRGKELKVKLEADVKQLKEAFEKSRIEADLELKKLSGIVSNSSTDAVDGITLFEENELMERMKISMARYDGLSPDDDYKASLCDSSFHDVPSYLSGSRSFGSSVDESPVSSEDASTIDMEGEVAHGLNDLIELVRNMKTSLAFDNSLDLLNFESSDVPVEACSLFAKLNHKQLQLTISDKMYLLEADNSLSSSSSSSSEPNSSSPVTRPDSISSCYSNFLIFLSSCFESFSLQPKKFYQQLEDIRYSDEITKNLEYFNVILPMAVVLKLKKISDWIDPTFQKLKNKSFLGRLKSYFKVNFSRSEGIGKQKIEASSSILSKQLLRQRKELEVVLKDLDLSKCITRKINEIFKELNESMSKLPSGGDNLHEHLNGIENSLGKLKKEMEALKSSSGFYSGSDGLTQALFELLEAKRDEITSEVDRRKREAGEHLDMVKQHKKEVETLEFKLVLHQKWLSESDKMEFNVENTDIFKFIEHETRSRIHEIFKMRTSLDLMIENQRWRSQPTCSVDAGLFCSHIDMEQLKLIKPVEADANNENMQLHSSIVCLFNETYSFWKRLRKHQLAKSSMDLLIDTNQLEHFNQLEMALKNGDVVEDEAHETPTSTIGCYKDILEHLVVLKLSVSSMDVSKRTISFTNVQAYIRKFSVIKQELLDLLQAINKFSRSTHSLDESASDLRCIWEVLCCNVLSQIQVLGHFMRQANEIKTKIEELKEDISVIECHFYDLQNMYCMSSHLEHYEELELASKEMEKEVLVLLDECQRITVEHRGCWNIQSLHIEVVNVLRAINKFSSDLDASKTEFVKKLEMWIKFSKTSSQMLTKLHALEFSLRRTCKECQLEENIHLLKNTFSQELQEINRNLRNLELEKFKLSSNDDKLPTCMAFQITSLKRFFEACSTKVFVRLQKLRRVSETILRFDKSLDNFKGWMMMKETELNAPFKFLNCHFEEILRTTQALRTSQVDVELKSRICSTFFGVCQVLCHDSDACPSVVEQDAVMTTMDLLEHKWNNIVCLALSRKSKLEEVWKHWKKYFADCEAAKNVVTSVKNELAQHRDFENFESLSICSMKEASHFYKKLILHMEEEHQKRDELKENYKQMALSLWVDEAGEMQAELETLWSDWQETEHSIRLIGRRIGYHLDLFKMFQSSAVSLHEWLLGISASLEQMEKSFEVDPEFNCRKNFKLIKKMKREVRLKLQEFNEVAKSLDVVVEDVKRGGICGDETAEDEAFNRGAKELLENFSKFQSEILLRIKNMEKKMNRGSHEIVENDPNQGSNVDEIESQRPISSHLDKSTEDSSALIGAKSDDWTNDAYSTFQTQILILFLIAAACLLPVSRIRASDLVHSLTRR